MDSAGYQDKDKSRASDVPSATFDEKPGDRSSLSSRESISQQQDVDAIRGKEELVADLNEGEREAVGEGDFELEQVKSKQPSVRDAASIPNGGLWAWLQVLGAFFLFFNSWYVHLDPPSLLPSNSSRWNLEILFDRVLTTLAGA